MDEPMTASATAATYIAFFLSLIAIIFVCIRRASGKPLLAYEPRQRVPWGMFAILVPLFCVVDKFGMLLYLAVFPAEELKFQPDKFVVDGLAGALLVVGFVVVAIPWMTIVCGATARDLGLPTCSRQLGRDIGIGVFACLVSLLPILALQNFLTLLLEPEQNHQLIELILEHKSPKILLVSIVMAVIAAPIFEEFTFRLLLQGWLERREDEQLGVKETERQASITIEPQEDTDADTDVSAATVDPLPAEVFEIVPSTTSTTAAPTLPSGIQQGLPHGWTPILISGVAFGLAHVGQGVAPIPLVLFGIVLGYLYQRTHRLAPCITAHALFNAYSMTILWLQIG